MRDRFGRKIEYLRVSVTDRCNMRCMYCMPEGFTAVRHDDVLRYEEILRIVRCCASLGIRFVRVTGGEPLVRKGAPDFVAALKEIPGIETVTMTTNGVLLRDYAEPLAKAGLDGVNVSLDTVDEDLAECITRRQGTVRATEEGIRAAQAYGIPVKINAVLLDETLPTIGGLLRFAEEGIPVRFIELMPIGYGKNRKGPTPEQAREEIRKICPDLTESDVRQGIGPARYYTSTVLKAPIGFIEAISRNFCEACNRIRLTSTGLMKACLCFEQGTDLSGPIRSGCSDEALTERIRGCIYDKPAKHCFDERDRITEEKLMSQIGG